MGFVIARHDPPAGRLNVAYFDLHAQGLLRSSQRRFDMGLNTYKRLQIPVFHIIDADMAFIDSFTNHAGFHFNIT
jgi:prepilin-type processing-associated H-X9-DG protein